MKSGARGTGSFRAASFGGRAVQTSTRGRMSAELLFWGFGLSLAAAMFSAAFLRGVGTDGHGDASDAASLVPAAPGRARPAATRSRVPEDRETPASPPAAPERPTIRSLALTLRGSGTTAEKLEALNAVCRGSAKPDLDCYSLVFTEGDAALRLEAALLLSKSAPSDEKARALLLRYAETHPADDPARATALAAVLLSGTDDELSRCGEILARETDAEAVAGACRTLSANPSSAANTLLDSLAATHPDSAARHRAQEERSGEYCEEHRPRPDQE